MLLLIIVFALMALLSKPGGYAYCGIFGFAGISKPDMMAIKLLGMYNLSRGKDSCGIFVGPDYLKHGTYTEKEWPKFIENNDIPEPFGVNVVIAHTRAASVSGAHNEKNAHPFIIHEDLVGVHNGTIQNIDELVKKYQVDVTGIEVDSQKLYKIIYEKGYQVLNDYVGYAALLWTYKSQPNIVYAYRGVSRRIAGQTLWEERPLYWLNQNNGFYFSSLKDSLLAIRKNTNQKIEELEYNRVIRIDCTKKKVALSIVYKVDRENMNIGIDNYYASNWGPVKQSRATTNETSKISAKLTNYVSSSTNTTFFKGRYLVAGSPLHGQFTMSDNGGMVSSNVSGSNWKPVYFFRGVRIKDHESYQKVTRGGVESLLDKHPNKTAVVLSLYSTYPVCVLSTESNMDELKETWYWMGHVWPFLNFSPLGSYNEYTIMSGKAFYQKASGLNSGAKTEVVWTKNSEGVTIPFSSIGPFDREFYTPASLKEAISGIFAAAIIEAIDDYLIGKGILSIGNELNEALINVIAVAIADRKSIRSTLAKLYEGFMPAVLEVHMEKLLDRLINKENGGNELGKSLVAILNKNENLQRNIGERSDDKNTSTDKYRDSDDFYDDVINQKQSVVTYEKVEEEEDVAERSFPDDIDVVESPEDQFVDAVENYISSIEDCFMELENMSGSGDTDAEEVAVLVFERLVVVVETTVKALKSRGYDGLADKLKNKIEPYYFQDEEKA